MAEHCARLALGANCPGTAGAHPSQAKHIKKGNAFTCGGLMPKINTTKHNPLTAKKNHRQSLAIAGIYFYLVCSH